MTRDWDYVAPHMIGVSNYSLGSKQGAPGRPRLESSNSVLVRNRDRLGYQVIGGSESEYYREKEFLRDFIAEIGIDPDAGRGVITFYELPLGSLMGVPGARDAPLKTIRSKRLDEFGLPGEGVAGGRLS
jgi:hypothetical protein